MLTSVGNPTVPARVPSIAATAAAAAAAAAATAGYGEASATRGRHPTDSWPRCGCRRRAPARTVMPDPLGQALRLSIRMTRIDDRVTNSHRRPEGSERSDVRTDRPPEFTGGKGASLGLRLEPLPYPVGNLGAGHAGALMIRSGRPAVVGRRVGVRMNGDVSRCAAHVERGGQSHLRSGSSHWAPSGRHRSKL